MRGEIFEIKPGIVQTRVTFQPNWAHCYNLNYNKNFREFSFFFSDYFAEAVQDFNDSVSNFTKKLNTVDLNR